MLFPHIVIELFGFLCVCVWNKCGKLIEKANIIKIDLLEKKRSLSIIWLDFLIILLHLTVTITRRGKALLAPTAVTIWCGLFELPQIIRLLGKTVNDFAPII